jgi:hypothetical protein
MPGAVDLVKLGERLAAYSHGSEALAILREELNGLTTQDRVNLLNLHLLCAPISYDAVRALWQGPLDQFYVLQGDVVRTEAAYVLGARQVGNPSYVVATSTCDLVPGRRKTASLLRVQAYRVGYAGQRQIARDLERLTLFETTRYFYLPPLPDDENEVLFNVVHIDEPAQCTNDTLAVVERRASMTLLGWRVFGALLRSLQVREAKEEPDIRALYSH